MITVGIDLGSAATKIVFTDGDSLLWSKAFPTLPEHSRVCQQVIDEGLKELSIKREEIAGIATTGYGRRLFPNSERVVDEISANAIGIHILSNKTARTLINIGGQDVKVIKISSDGSINDFKMNDKCAAGTGRFFEMASRILNTPIEEFANLSTLSHSPVCINSTCTVFAETEIVSLLATGENINDIISGLHTSVARRISELTASLHLEEKIYLDGGPALNKGLLASVEEELMTNVNVLPYPQFTVAFGAAFTLLKEKQNR